MSNHSSMTPDEKAKIKAALTDFKILTAALCRIYYAYPDPQQWSYSGLQGGLALVADRKTDARHLKLVELAGAKGVVWDHELWNGFRLTGERPFFQTFDAGYCVVGVVYADESEAETMLKKCNKRKSKPRSRRSSLSKRHLRSSSKVRPDKSAAKASSPACPQNTDMAPLKYDEEKGFISEEEDPSWLALLNSLEKYGVRKDDIFANMDFICSFLVEARERGSIVALPKAHDLHESLDVSAHPSVAAKAENNGPPPLPPRRTRPPLYIPPSPAAPPPSPASPLATEATKATVRSSRPSVTGTMPKARIPAAPSRALPPPPRDSFPPLRTRSNHNPNRYAFVYEE